MSDGSRIAWTDATWNPVTGCSRVSPGCAHCYAERLSHRFGWTTRPWTARHALANVQLHPDRLRQPLRWRHPRRVFVNSMSDLFHEQVPDAFLDQVFAGMALAPQHVFQVLTKRPRRAAAWWMDPVRCARITAAVAALAERPLAAPLPWPLPHVWLGVSAEDQRRAAERLPILTALPAAVRFVSCEPLLGPVDLQPWLDRLDWVIAGGESGPGARPCDPDWVRALRDQCAAAGVPFFFKQWGGPRPDPEPPLLDGRAWAEIPVAWAAFKG